jgi:hypothetical protein
MEFRQPDRFKQAGFSAVKTVYSLFCTQFTEIWKTMLKNAPFRPVTGPGYKMNMPGIDSRLPF